MYMGMRKLNPMHIRCLDVIQWIIRAAERRASEIAGDTNPSAGDINKVWSDKNDNESGGRVHYSISVADDSDEVATPPGGTGSADKSATMTGIDVRGAIPDFLAEILLDVSDDELRARIEKNMKPGFRDVLTRFIAASGLSEVDVYKRAMLDRRTFYKIRRDDKYHPSKETVLALGLAMRLSIPNMEELLTVAGYFLSESIMRDATIKYFMYMDIYDIFTINEYLANYDCPLLGNVKN